MQDPRKYRNSFPSISDEEMRFCFNRKSPHKKPDGYISLEEAMQGCTCDLCVRRHALNTLDMYHSYGVYTFCYISSGQFVMYTNDIHPIELRQGNMCILPPEISYKISMDYACFASDPGIKNVLVTVLIPEPAVSRIFSRLLTEKSPVADYLNSSLYGRKFKSYMILRSPGEMNATLAELTFRAIEKANQPEEHPISAECLINSLLLDYVRDDSCVFDYGPVQQNADPMPAIINYIHTNFRTVTLEDICREFHYTPSHFCTMIKKRTGSTMTEFIASERLDFVCKQLALTDKKIKAIVEESGYVSLEHFYRVFKKHYGITPKEYRRRLTQKTSEKSIDC